MPNNPGNGIVSNMCGIVRSATGSTRHVTDVALCMMHLNVGLEKYVFRMVRARFCVCPCTVCMGVGGCQCVNVLDMCPA